LEITGGRHETFYVIPAGLVGIACSGDFACALDRPSISENLIFSVIARSALRSVAILKIYCHCRVDAG